MLTQEAWIYWLLGRPRLVWTSAWRRIDKAVASPRERSSSLAMMLDTWAFTVRSAILSRMGQQAVALSQSEHVQHFLFPPSEPGKVGSGHIRQMRYPQVAVVEGVERVVRGAMTRTSGSLEHLESPDSFA